MRASCVVCVLVLLVGGCGGSRGDVASASGYEGRAGVQWRPVVLMHGLVADKSHMQHLEDWIRHDFPGIYVYNVEIGNGFLDSIFMGINSQVEEFARKVQAKPELANGFNLVGHSQGGLIARAYVERYNTPPVYNLISWAGPQAGVYGIPFLNALCPDAKCPGLPELATLIADGWDNRTVQEHIAPAGYWRPPFNVTAYLSTNMFLADINNERAVKNGTYRSNMLSLNTLALGVASKDSVVVPKTSPWFSFYADNSDTRVVPWNQTQGYEEDWVGLRTLQESGRVRRAALPCTHMGLKDPPCKPYSYDSFARPLLNNTLPST